MSLEDQLAEVESAEMVDLDLADEDPRPKRARQQKACDVMQIVASWMWLMEISSDTLLKRSTTSCVGGKKDTPTGRFEDLMGMQKTTLNQLHIFI